MNNTDNNTEATATWAEASAAVSAAARQSAADAADWVRENPQTAAAAAAVVGVGIGYLLFN